MTNKPRALYIHIPFCNYICDYCDFAKLLYFPKFISPYLNSLEKEIKSLNIEELDTIYIGGGTPTCLSEEELERLLKMVLPYIKGVKEYTVEANPDSLNVNKLKLLFKYGVNRLSIGVESTDDSILKAINRHHTFNDVINIIKQAREIGFKNINVDLILGLPNATKELLKQDIQNILSLNTEHISCYSLSINEHSAFYIRGVKEPDDDLLREYYDYVHQELANANYIHYEISNWAKEGYYSKHNLVYWNNEPFYGVGLGASGEIDNIIYQNTRSLNHYIEGKYRKEEIIMEKDDANYYIMLKLRTIFGLNFDEFKNKYSVDLLEVKHREIDEFTTNNFLYIENNTLKPTYEGMMILDNLLRSLFL